MKILHAREFFFLTAMLLSVGLSAQGSYSLLWDVGKTNVSDGYYAKALSLGNYDWDEYSFAAAFQLDFMSANPNTFSGASLQAGRRFSIYDQPFRADFFIILNRFSELLYETNWGLLAEKRHDNFCFRLGTGFRAYRYTRDAIDEYNINTNKTLRWEEYYARLGSSTYLFTVRTPEATDLYICLDSGSGTLGSKQLKWLRETLENKRQDYRHCIVMTHNNFFRFRRTGSTNPLVEELHVLMEMFTRHNVNMLITGHDHRRSNEVFGLTRYLTLDALLDGFSHASYMVLTLENGKIGIEFISL